MNLKPLAQKLDIWRFWTLLDLFLEPFGPPNHRLKNSKSSVRSYFALFKYKHAPKSQKKPIKMPILYYYTLPQSMLTTVQWWKKQTGQTPFIGIKWLFSRGRGP